MGLVTKLPVCAVQGRAEAGVALMTGGVAALLRVLEESLPRLEAVGTSDTSAVRDAAGAGRGGVGRQTIESQLSENLPCA